MTAHPEVLLDDVGFVEGPAACDDGTVAFTSITQAAVYRRAVDGTVKKVSTGGGPNGLTVGADGALFVAQNGGLYGGMEGTDPGIQRITRDDVEHLLTIPDGAPNDLCFGPDGRLYFTDSRAAWDGAGPAPVGQLLSCSADGSDLVQLFDGLAFANGLAFDHEGAHLVVVESEPRRILIFEWSGTDGLGEPSEFCRLQSGGPDGVAFDRDGHLWVAATTADAVEVYAPTGSLIARHDFGPGSMPTNCCFGVADPSNLYVTAAGTGQLLRLATSTTGAALCRA